LVDSRSSPYSKYVPQFNSELSRFSFLEEYLSPQEALEEEYRKRNREVVYTVEEVKEEAARLSEKTDCGTKIIQI